MKGENLNKFSFVIYSIIIGFAICSLILNITIFTVVLNYNPKGDIILAIYIPPIYITHLSLEVIVFFVIIIISCLEILLNLIKRHRYLKYYLVGISSIVPISSCLMIFIDPKLLVLNQEVYQPDFSVNFHNISIGGIIAIILSSLLIVNSIVTIFIDLKRQSFKKIDESEVHGYHNLSKS